jgi:hypothetical protein
MPPSLLLAGRVDRLLALQLGALKDTLSPLVTLEAQFFLLASLTLTRCQSSFKRWR